MKESEYFLVSCSVVLENNTAARALHITSCRNTKDRQSALLQEEEKQDPLGWRGYYDITQALLILLGYSQPTRPPSPPTLGLYLLLLLITNTPLVVYWCPCSFCDEPIDFCASSDFLKPDFPFHLMTHCLFTHWLHHLWFCSLGIIFLQQFGLPSSQFVPRKKRLLVAPTPSPVLLS